MNPRAVLDGLIIRLKKNVDFLNELDRLVGDGDHGTTLERIAQNLSLKKEEVENYPTLFFKLANSFSSSGGGAASALFSYCFMRVYKLAKKWENSTIFTVERLKEITGEFADSIQRVGRAKVGDKTMLDIWYLFFQWLNSVNSVLLADLPLFKKLANNKLKNLLEDQKSLVAGAGRASYIGERTKGKMDPGSASSRMIIQSFLDAVE